MSNQNITNNHSVHEGFVTGGPELPETFANEQELIAFMIELNKAQANN